MTTLQYDVTCETPGDQPVRIVLRCASQQQARSAIYTALALRYGEGAIYGDGWRFVHERSPNFKPSKLSFPPVIGETHPRGPVDAAISLIVVQPPPAPRIPPAPVPDEQPVTPTPVPPRDDLDDWLAATATPRVTRSQLVLTVLLLLVIVALIAELEGGAP